MKNRAWIVVSVAVVVLSISFSSIVIPAAPAVTLTVHNPRGEITLPPVIAPRARLGDMSEKKIGLYWNGKAGGNNFWNAIEALLKEKIPNATILRYQGAFDLGDTQASQMAKEVDGFFYGVGD
jgi:hypothetical protein